MDNWNASRGAAAIANEVRKLYREGMTDYDLPPIVLVDDNGAAGVIRDGDAVIFCCRRGEREIQLTRAFVDPAFNEFPQKNFRDLTFVTLTLYNEIFLNMPVDLAFPPLLKINDTLGEVVSRCGLRQLRVAESEKFAHVTYFLNGCNSQSFPGQEVARIPSPRNVPFDQIPELSSKAVADTVIKNITSDGHDLIIVNFANGDIIAHFDNRQAKIECSAAVDRQLGRLLEAAVSAGYVTVITADHGVLEKMVKPDGTPNISHTDSRVPMVVADSDPKIQSAVKLKTGGSLTDVAPTVLEIMGLPKPEAMTGRSLLQNYPDFSQGRKVLLVILDGWGLGNADETNPIFLADTPVWDRLTGSYPFAALKASGKAVGLLAQKPGNSEAGHVSIGAGRLVLQDDARIALAIEDGTFNRNLTFLKTISAVKKRDTALHLISFLSDTSSHGSIDYPVALLRLAQEQSLKRVMLHAIFDGRSTKIRSAPIFLERLEKEMATLGIGAVVSGIGRALALDRDGDYQKTRQAYDALVFGVGRRVR